MQHYRAWWREGEMAHLEQAVTRARNSVEAQAKVEEALGHKVEGVELVKGHYLQFIKNNKTHYRWVE